MISFIRFLVITHIHLITFIGLFPKIVLFYVNSIFAVSRLIYLQSLFLHHFYLSDLFHQIICHQSYLSDIFYHIVCHDFLYFSGVSNFLVAYSEIYFFIVMYNCRGNFEKRPCKPIVSLIINVITRIQYIT